MCSRVFPVFGNILLLIVSLLLLLLFVFSTTHSCTCKLLISISLHDEKEIRNTFSRNYYYHYYWVLICRSNSSQSFSNSTYATMECCYIGCILYSCILSTVHRVSLIIAQYPGHSSNIIISLLSSVLVVHPTLQY